MKTLRYALGFVCLFWCLARGGSGRFVILSDLHPHDRAYDQLELLTAHVIALRPVFVIVLGDIGNHHVPGSSEREIEAIAETFRRMREHGIEVFPVMGNHDVHRAVEAIKTEWLCAQHPLPLNSLFVRAADTEAYRAFRSGGPYNYSFQRGGIHFCVIDSTCLPGSPRWDAHRRWMAADLVEHVNNPDRLPALVFLHHPEYMSGARGMTSRPLFEVLAQGAAQHTVKAVFGGHWHYGEHFPREDNLGIDVYATPASVLGSEGPVEFIVADVTPEGIVFSARDTFSGRPRVAPGPIAYLPVPGRFGPLERVVAAADGAGAARGAMTLGADLLHNGSFENGIWYSRFRGWSPAGWYQWFIRGGHVPEHAVGQRLPHSGSEYVRLHMWAHAWCGGILQNVHGVEPCHMYRLRAYGFFQPPDAPGTGARIGLDPTGALAAQFSADVSAHPAPPYDEGVGDDPKTPEVEGPGFPEATCWSDTYDTYRWGAFDVVAEARAPTITAILYCNPAQRPADRPIYEMNWDTVSLRKIPWPTRRLVADDAVLAPSAGMTGLNVVMAEDRRSLQVTWRSQDPAGAAQVLYGFSREDPGGMYAGGGAPRSHDFALETPVVYERSSRFHTVAVQIPADTAAAFLDIVALSRVLVDGACVTQSTAPLRLRLARTLPILSAADAGQWTRNINEGGTMTHAGHPPRGMRFEMQFGDSDPWCYPILELDPAEIPDPSFRGLSLTVHLIEGEGAVRVQFLETQRTQYVAGTNYRSELRTPQRVTASFSGAQARPTSPADPNGRLDPEEIRWVMVGINSVRGSRVVMVVSDLEWIK